VFFYITPTRAKRFSLQPIIVASVPASNAAEAMVFVS
jgi:hypothetical protein